MRDGHQVCSVEQLDVLDDDDDQIHVALVGELDSANAVELMVRVTALIGDTPHVVLDFSGVTFVSASALSLVVRLSETRTAIGGSLVIRGARERDRRVIGWAHLEHLIEPDDDTTTPR